MTNRENQNNARASRRHRGHRAATIAISVNPGGRHNEQSIHSDPVTKEEFEELTEENARLRERLTTANQRNAQLLNSYVDLSNRHTAFLKCGSCGDSGGNVLDDSAQRSADRAQSLQLETILALTKLVARQNDRIDFLTDKLLMLQSK